MNCPKWIHQYAQELWPAVIEELERRGRMLLIHESQVIMFCECLAEYRLATEQLIKEGLTVEEDHTTETGGYKALKAHPANRIQVDRIKLAERLIKELGLNEPLSEDDQTALAGLSDWLDRARAGLQQPN
ncbi:phage terminase small subunit P27 family [Planctomicrobium sp. SH661]|uniref:phage terminase small subunit P27 family n=1 Tax=Planctomicrobium sp. SH661 TaxID=3448124 RepID=UPI003F5B16BD